MDRYISVTSLRLNQIMKVLTVVTVVFLPLLVGIYGTNLEYMPELKFTNAYFVLLGVIGLIVAVLLLFFWKMRWIRIAFWPQAMTPLAWISELWAAKTLEIWKSLATSSARIR